MSEQENDSNEAASATKADEQEYVLGTDDEELVRLGFQHEVWSAQAVGAWAHAGFAPGATILDVGCGPGYASFALSRLVGATGKVIAVDISPRFVAHLHARARALGVSNISATVADVEQLEVAASSCDGAYARWVLCFTPKPEAVIAGVARSLKPGAAFVVQDYFNYRHAVIAPPAEIFTRFFGAVDESFRARGGDPNIGSRLPQLMERHGLEVAEIKPLVRIARPKDSLWHWPQTFFESYLPTLVAGDYITQAEADEFISKWHALATDPAAFFATPPMIEVIGVKR